MKSKLTFQDGRGPLIGRGDAPTPKTKRQLGQKKIDTPIRTSSNPKIPGISFLQCGQRGRLSVFTASFTASPIRVVSFANSEVKKIDFTNATVKGEVRLAPRI
jgi:hypothetical protein